MFLCLICKQPVSKMGNVHVKCKQRRELLLYIDDGAKENDSCPPVDFWGNELNY